MKKALLLFVLALLGVVLSTEAAETSGLKVGLKSGGDVTFLFENKPELTFAADKLQIKTTDGSAPSEFAIDDVATITFVETTTGIGKTPSATAGITVAASGDNIVFGNLPEGSRVEIFTMDGKRLVSAKAGQQYVFAKGSVGHGMYIVKIGSFTTKISL